MTQVHLKINNKVIVADNTDTILTAALKNNIKIPTLCYLKNITKSGACRVCLVEVKKRKHYYPHVLLLLVKVWKFIQILVEH